MLPSPGCRRPRRASSLQLLWLCLAVASSEEGHAPAHRPGVATCGGAEEEVAPPRQFAALQVNHMHTPPASPGSRLWTLCWCRRLAVVLIRLGSSSYPAATVSIANLLLTLPPLFRDPKLAGCNTDCGRVEIRVAPGDEHGYVCSGSDAWSLKEAHVVCRTLGFAQAFGAMQAFGGAPAGMPAAVLSVVCRGDEASLHECDIELAGRPGAGAACNGTRAVGVSCITATELERDPAVQRRAAEVVSAWAERTQARKDQVRATWFPHGAGSGTAPPGAAAGGGAGCDVLPGVPLPFDAAVYESAYVLADQMAGSFDAMNTELRRRLCAPGDGPRIQRALASLARRGMRWNALGIDLTPLRGDVTQDELALVHELYLSHNAHGPLHWELDQPLRLQATPREKITDPAALKLCVLSRPRGESAHSSVQCPVRVGGRVGRGALAAGRRELAYAHGTPAC